MSNFNYQEYVKENLEKVIQINLELENRIIQQNEEIKRILEESIESKKNFESFVDKTKADINMVKLLFECKLCSGSIFERGAFETCGDAQFCLKCAQDYCKKYGKCARCSMPCARVFKVKIA